MHIAYVDPHPVPDRCPEALQILQSVNALAAIGVQVTLVTPEPADATDPMAILGRPLAPGARLVHLPDLRRRWWAPRRSNQIFYRQATRWLRAHPVDALLVRNLKLAEKLLRADGLPPLFFETHEIFAQAFREEHPRPDWLARRKLGLLEKREAYVYGHARGLMALTSLLLQDVRTTYGADTPGIVVPDGVDLAAAAAARTPRPDNPLPVALYLGSLHPWKGVDILIRAMQTVDEAMLWIAGGNDARIRELGELADSLGIAGRLRFLGEVPPAQRFKLINQADICLLPLNDTSIGGRYTSPLKLFEYLALGKPVVASDLPSIREVLQPGRNALLVPAGDPAAIGAAIRSLVADRGMREKLGAEALLLAGRYGWEMRAAAGADFMRSRLQGTA